jgi:hypothetical protein
MKTISPNQGGSWTSQESHRRLLGLTMAGGLVFWVTTIAISLLPLAAEYRSALGFQHATVLVQSLFMGIVLGGLVSYGLLRFYDRIPAKNPVSKAELLSGCALVLAIILVQGTMGLTRPEDGWQYFLIGSMLDAPRFILLGLAIGELYRRSPRA